MQAIKYERLIKQSKAKLIYMAHLIPEILHKIVLKWIVSKQKSVLLAWEKNVEREHTVFPSAEA